MTTHTKRALVQCIQRELDRRYKMFPKWVREGKMKQLDSTEQIALMTGVFRVIMAMPDEEIKEAQR